MLFNLPKSGHSFHPLLESIASRIRFRREELSDLTTLEIDPELLNIKCKLDGTECFINNELYRARGIRKLHLEIARLGVGFEILHCVFFPEPAYDIPIFGVDIVSAPKGILAAIVDLSPVSKDLPLNIQKELSENFTSKIKLEYKYDPTLIGGLIIQVESIMIDTSIKNRLKRLEQSIIEA